MTREEAKEFLKEIAWDLGFTGIEEYGCKDGEKMLEAIEVLDKEPCEDYISRAELLKAIDTWDKFGCDADTKLVPYKDHYTPYIHYDDVIKCIKGMPSVQPKTGHWLYNDGAYKCEFCGHEITGREEDLNYCCKCGAKLESEGK